MQGVNVYRADGQTLFWRGAASGSISTDGTSGEPGHALRAFRAFSPFPPR
jgi:hypothetical protein